MPSAAASTRARPGPAPRNRLFAQFSYHGFLMDGGLGDLVKLFQTSGQCLSGVIECSNGGPNHWRYGDVESRTLWPSNGGGLYSTSIIAILGLNRSCQVRLLRHRAHPGREARFKLASCTGHAFSEPRLRTMHCLAGFTNLRPGSRLHAR